MAEMHQQIPPNQSGRDFVVGDIHGCYALLEKHLVRIGFNSSQDRLFSVGDLIDRGKDSAKCLTLLDEPWFYAVLGNHEEMMINACTGIGEDYNWRREYGVWFDKLTAKEMALRVKQLRSLPTATTVQMDGYQVGICHAEPDGNNWTAMTSDMRSRNVMIWGRRVLRKRPKKSVVGVDVTFHGHTPLDKPKWVGNRYFMDTGAWYSGELTVRKIDDVFQEYSDRMSLFG